MLIQVAFWLYTIASSSVLLVGLARAYKWGSRLLAAHEELLTLQEHFKLNVPNQWIFWDGQGS